MEDSGSPQNGTSSRRHNFQWTPSLDKVFIECMVELVNRGGKKENGFDRGYLMKLQHAMAEKIPGCTVRGDPHIKSRMRTYKMHFREIREIRQQASGFGWNDATKTISCEDAVWNDWVKSHPQAAGLRNKPFPFYDELAICYGTDQANGEGAESPSEAAEAAEKEEAMKQSSPDDYFGVEIDLDGNEDVFVSDSGRSETSNAASKRARLQMEDERGSRPKKGKTAKEVDKAFLSRMDEIKEVCQGTRAEMTKVAAYFDKLNAKEQSKTSLYEMVTKIEGLTREEAIHAYGIIVADKGKSEAFMMIPDDDAKFIYVKGVVSGIL